MKVAFFITLGLGLGQGVDNQTHVNLARLMESELVLAGLADTFELFQKVPPRQLPNARNIPSVSVQSVGEHLRRSYISTCSKEKVLGISCVCSTRYKDVVIATDPKVGSWVLLAADVFKRHIVVAYSLTLTLRQWIVNIDYKLVQMRDAPTGVKVHQGLQRIHLSLIDKAFLAAKKLLDDPSLGGAVATLVVPDWYRWMKQNNYQNRMESYSYSSPRIGNEQFAQYIASTGVPTIRYTNQNDLVPHLPPRSMGFVHAGLEYHFAEGRIVQCRQDFDEDPNCSVKHSFPLSLIKHYYPDGKLFPIPPFC
ncbi:hypothetical protein L0F63_006525 [Massospora cicadina]|nr:hypothetical protein L0F63_006525 [Massospora cicadina]